MHIGSGRILEQDLTRIDASMSSGKFTQNPILLEACELTRKSKANIHIFGLLSPGGVHSHESHIFALIEFLKQSNPCPCYVHAFLDGRDTPPRSARPSLEKLENLCQNSSVTPASISGRYFAMDRDKRWERVERCYDALTNAGDLLRFDSAVNALDAAYKREESDEFVSPSLLRNFEGIQDNDVILFMNFRADRAREISRAFTDYDFQGFSRKKFPKISLFTMTEYEEGLNARILFPPPSIENTLGEIVSSQGLKQLRIAETEKYAHVSFFLNGGREAPFPGEERILLPSPKVATYDLQPEMSAFEITETLLEKIRSEAYALIVLNFANADMVGHTGDFNAAVKAIEAIDACLGRIAEAAKTTHAELIITADHGNAESMFDDKTHQAHTAHTHNLVPCLHVGTPSHPLAHSGSLIDIAPTILKLLDLPIPEVMQGHPLFELES